MMNQKINVGDYVIWDDEDYPYVVESIEDGIATLAEVTHGNVVIREWVATTELRKMTEAELEDWFGDGDDE